MKIRILFNPILQHTFCSFEQPGFIVNLQISKLSDEQALRRANDGWLESDPSKLRFGTTSPPLGAHSNWVIVSSAEATAEVASLAREYFSHLPKPSSASQIAALVKQMDKELNPKFSGEELNFNGLFQTVLITEPMIKTILASVLEDGEPVLTVDNLTKAMDALLAYIASNI